MDQHSWRTLCIAVTVSLVVFLPSRNCGICHIIAIVVAQGGKEVYIGSAQGPTRTRRALAAASTPCEKMSIRQLLHMIRGQWWGYPSGLKAEMVGKISERDVSWRRSLEVRSWAKVNSLRRVCHWQRSRDWTKCLLEPEIDTLDLIWRNLAADECEVARRPSNPADGVVEGWNLSAESEPVWLRVWRYSCQCTVYDLR